MPPSEDTSFPSSRAGPEPMERHAASSRHRGCGRGSVRLATPLRAATPSLNASITRQITADRAALAQTQSRQRRFVRQLRVAESKSATVSDPFDYEDGVARLRLAAASAARQVSA